MAHLTVVGSANIDHTVVVDRWPAPGETLLAIDSFVAIGGKGANQAVAAARAGASVEFVGAVGPDGEAVLSALASRGVATAQVRRSTRPTGSALITLGPGGDNLIVVASGANDDVVAPESIDGVALVQLEIPLEVVRQVSERCDRFIVNLSPIREIPTAVLAAADPLIVNETEAATLDLSVPKSVVITRGAAGAELRDANGARRFDAPRVTVVDTTGAGDAFAGALAAAIAAGDDLDSAVRAGIAAGSAAVQYRGAQPPVQD
jgi:ribokinase